MTDIVERLRNYECNFAVYDEAADEIERLRSALIDVQDWCNVVGVGPVPTTLRTKVLLAIRRNDAAPGA